jgi:casein kinase 1
VKVFQVSYPTSLQPIYVDRTAEDFAIYMNYVRKLGFEENPDYDFLRELFTKVLKTLGEPEDGVFDWMLINNKPGWDGNVGFVTA